MYVFLLLNFGRDLDPGPNTRGTPAHTRASVRQTLATLSKHLRCSRLNTWPELCYQPREIRMGRARRTAWRLGDDSDQEVVTG